MKCNICIIIIFKNLKKKNIINTQGFLFYFTLWYFLSVCLFKYVTCSLYSTWTFLMMRQCFCRIEMAWANGIPENRTHGNSENIQLTNPK